MYDFARERHDAAKHHQPEYESYSESDELEEEDESPVNINPLFRQLSPKELKEWQIWWYEQRLKKARDPNEKTFAANQLRNLKKSTNGTHSIHH